MSKYSTIDVSKPTPGRVVMKDKYWLCKDGDPTQAIFYGQTAQCNQYKQIPDRMKEYTEKQTGWKVGVVFMEFSYRPQIND